MQAPNYYKSVRRVITINVIVHLLLALIKLCCGYWTRSHALFADGLHSLSDLVTDLCVWFATRYGSRKADKHHPYGHARIETLAVVGMAIVISFVGLGIVVDASMRLLGLSEQLHVFSVYSVWIAGLSIVINEALYQYTMRVAKSIGSAMLKATAWHNRSDVASSLVVFFGLLGSGLGYTYLDPVAAIIVGLMIIKMGCWDLGWSSIRELIDTGLDEEELVQIKSVIEAVPGVRSLHQLRTRLMAGSTMVDVHILVDPHLSVSEGHYIGEQVQWQLCKQLEKVIDVTVHVDPEDDEQEMSGIELPTRSTLMAVLEQRWQHLPGANTATVDLHYLGGKLQVDLCLIWQQAGDDPRATAEAYSNVVLAIPEVTQVSVSFLVLQDCRDPGGELDS